MWLLLYLVLSVLLFYCCCFLFFSFHLCVGYFCLVCDCHTGKQCQAILASSHPQSDAGEGVKGPNAKLCQRAPNCSVTPLAAENRRWRHVFSICRRRTCGASLPSTATLSSTRSPTGDRFRRLSTWSARSGNTPSVRRSRSTNRFCSSPTRATWSAQGLSPKKVSYTIDGGDGLFCYRLPAVAGR